MKKFVFIGLCFFIGFSSFSSVSNNSRVVISEEFNIPGDVAFNNEGCHEEKDMECIGEMIIEQSMEGLMEAIQ